MVELLFLDNANNSMLRTKPYCSSEATLSKAQKAQPAICTTDITYHLSYLIGIMAAFLCRGSNAAIGFHCKSLIVSLHAAQNHEFYPRLTIRITFLSTRILLAASGIYSNYKG
jgi:hypothetical protein